MTIAQVLQQRSNFASRVLLKILEWYSYIFVRLLLCGDLHTMLEAGKDLKLSNLWESYWNCLN